MVGYGSDRTRDFFFQSDPNSPNFFYSNDISGRPVSSALRLSFEDLDLNSQISGFPNLEGYEGFLQGGLPTGGSGRFEESGEFGGSGGFGGVGGPEGFAGSGRSRGGGRSAAPIQIGGSGHRHDGGGGGGSRNHPAPAGRSLGVRPGHGAARGSGRGGSPSPARGRQASPGRGARRGVARKGKALADDNDDTSESNPEWKKLGHGPPHDMECCT